MTLEQLNIPIPKTAKRVSYWIIPKKEWYGGAYDEDDYSISYEDYTGYWNKKTYDENGNRISYEYGNRKKTNESIKL